MTALKKNSFTGKALGWASGGWCPIATLLHIDSGGEKKFSKAFLYKMEIIFPFPDILCLIYLWGKNIFALLSAEPARSYCGKQHSRDTLQKKACTKRTILKTCRFRMRIQGHECHLHRGCLSWDGREAESTCFLSCQSKYFYALQIVSR